MNYYQSLERNKIVDQCMNYYHHSNLRQNLNL
nr:MAG TPA: hypothetical protein [Caudoviricetes sp.]